MDVNLERSSVLSHLIPLSVEDVCEALQKASFQEVKAMAELGGPTFCRDPLCPDTLALSQQLSALVQFSALAEAHVLHTQVMENKLVREVHAPRPER